MILPLWKRMMTNDDHGKDVVLVFLSGIEGLQDGR